MYEMKYDIGRFKLDYTVNVKANIDEPSGRINRDDRFMKKKLIQFGIMFGIGKNN